MARVAVIGSGLIGRSWSVVFALAGHETLLFDQDPARSEEALAWAAATLCDLQAAGLTDEPAAAAGRIGKVDTLEAAVRDAVWVQECTLEQAKLKREVFAALDRAAAEDTILASSSSGLVPSLFTEDLPGRRRCLVAHPINPPHLIPLVEIVQAPWTDEEFVDRAMTFLRDAGQEPIRVQGEIAGFVHNRLQGALLDEAFRLVELGHATPEDVDRAMVYGLAPRWSFMGPFETIDLNAPAGVRDYVDRYRTMYFEMHRQRGQDRPWSEAAVAAIVAARRADLPQDRIAERQLWRDRMLMKLAADRARRGY